MDGQELYHMKNMLKEKSTLQQLCTDPTWLHAFAYYNQSNPENRLSTNCLECYMKVYLYHKRIYDAN
jgi:hypothetical protein